MKCNDLQNFNLLKFFYCTNDIIRRLFPSPPQRGVVMHWVIPLKYRHNPQLIRNYLFFGSRQKKVLLDADGLWSDCNEEVEAYRGD